MTSLFAQEFPVVRRFLSLAGSLDQGLIPRQHSNQVLPFV